MNMSGSNLERNIFLLAAILDGVNGTRWMLSEDGRKGVNRPRSVLSLFTKGEDEEEDNTVQVFSSPEDFLAARERIIGG